MFGWCRRGIPEDLPAKSWTRPRPCHLPRRYFLHAENLEWNIEDMLSFFLYVQSIMHYLHYFPKQRLNLNVWCKLLYFFFSDTRRIPTFRTGGGLMWWYAQNRWMTNRERLSSLAFPVTPEVASSMNVPQLPIRDHSRASAISGNSMCFATAAIVQLVALICFQQTCWIIQQNDAEEENDSTGFAFEILRLIQSTLWLRFGNLWPYLKIEGLIASIRC